MVEQIQQQMANNSVVFVCFLQVENFIIHGFDNGLVPTQ